MTARQFAVAVVLAAGVAILARAVGTVGFEDVYEAAKGWQTVIAGLLVIVTAWVAFHSAEKRFRRDDVLVRHQLSAVAIEVNYFALEIVTVASLLNAGIAGGKRERIEEALLKLATLPKLRFFTEENTDCAKLPPEFIKRVLFFHNDLSDVVLRYTAQADLPDKDRELVILRERLNVVLAKADEAGKVAIALAEKLGETLQLEPVAYERRELS